MAEYSIRSFLFSYLVSPVKTIEKSSVTTPLKPCFFVIFLLAIGSNLGFTLYSGQSLYFLIVMSFFFHVFFVAFEAVFVDFIAQIFGFKAQSLNLFSWLGLTSFPFLLSPPLALLHHAGFLSSGLFGFAMVLLFFLSLYLQIITISRTYAVSFFKGLCFLCAPLFLLGAFIVIMGLSFIGTIPFKEFL